MTKKSVLDLLEDNISIIPDLEEEELLVPILCEKCKNQMICSILPTFIAMLKIGIIAGIEKCPYHSKL